MSTRDEDDSTIYVVVVNQEEQYSIWPSNKVIPQGWSRTDQQGSKSECLTYIKQVWPDVRPRSLREATVTSGTAGES